MQRRTPRTPREPSSPSTPTTQYSSSSANGASANDEEEDKQHAVDAEVKKKGLTKVLDWKNDFINLEWRKQYYAWNNKSTLYLARANISLVVVGYLFLIVLSGFYYRNQNNNGPDPNFNVSQFVKDAKTVIPVVAYVGFSLILLMVPRVKNHAAYVGPLCFTGLIVLYLYQRISPNGTLVDPDAHGPSIFMLTVFVTMRPPIKSSAPFMAIPVIVHIASTAFDDYNENKPWYFIFGLMVMMTIIYVVGIFCGSELEKRAKFDYVVKHFMDIEAEKLSRVVARDLAMLRNIFPKNLSDELEKQMNSGKQYIPSESVRNNFSGKSLKQTSIANLIKGASNRIHPLGFKPVSTESPDSSPAPVRARSTPATPQAPAPTAAPASLPLLAPISSSAPDRFSVELESIAEGGKTIIVGDVSGSSPPSARPMSTNAWRSLSITLPSDISAAGVTNSALSPNSRMASAMTTPVYQIPAVINPLTASPARLPSRHLTTSGKPLYSQHRPEIFTYFNGAQHEDGSLVSLSHSYPSVTVVFADIVGFTALSSTISPEELVGMLNYIFSKFDDIVEDLQLEKIRTLGDAYLCVANMSIPLNEHESSAVEAGVRMLRVVQSIDGKNLNLRVGIASGALLAGVTGLTKWNYDIFGSVVKEASIIETFADPGSILVSKSVYEGAKHTLSFEFEYCPPQGEDGLVLYKLINQTNKIQVIEAVTEAPIVQEKYLELNLDLPATQELTLDDLRIDTDRPDSGFSSSFSQIDPNSFDYTKEDLETATTTLDKAWVWMRFKNPTFEQEFHQNITHKTYSYTIKYIYLVLFTTVSYLFIDMMIDTSNTHTPAFIITRLIQFAVCLGYLWFIRKHNEWKYEEYVGMLFVWIYGFATCINTYFHPYIFQIHRVPLILSTTAMCMRVRGFKMLTVLVTTCVFGSTLALLHPITKANVLTPFILHYYVLLVTFITTFFIEKSFRREFLNRKVIVFNVFQQKQAQARSNLLLYNLLPKELVPRLLSNTGNTTTVDKFEDATMMFVNLTNLDEITNGLSDGDVFKAYNEIFTLFDQATRDHGLEKIKTINTIYMVAAGLPKKTDTHEEDAVLLAKALHQIAMAFHVNGVHKPIKLRVGIASGPVVAGIIGKKKYAYDCWSDTTNTASRMESNGWTGYVQVTPKMYESLREKYVFQRRDNIYIKGKGDMNLYVMPL